MEPTRILHIVTSLSFNDGVMSTIMNIYRFIDRNLIQFDFLYHHEFGQDYSDEISSLGGKTFKLRVLSLKTSIKYLHDLDVFFKHHSYYQVVHAHAANYNVFSLYFALNSGISIRIAHSHSSNTSNSAIKKIRSFILKLPLKKLATDYFSCSDLASIHMFGKNYQSYEHFFLLPNSIDITKFQFNKTTREDKRNTLHLNDSFVLGHVGRFSVLKNHNFIIDIFNELLKLEPNSKLLLVGEGEDMNEIRKKVAALNLNEFVLFLGVISDTSAIYQAIDVFILPSLSEGLPMVVLEAQTAGLPCIISDTITTQVKISDSVFFKSIMLAAKNWALDISKFKYGYARKSAAQEMIHAGFDSPTIAQKYLTYILNHRNLNR